MLVWWAVFFVSGIASCPGSIIPSLMVFLFMLRFRPVRTETWRLAFFVLCVSTSLVISTAALRQDRNDIDGALARRAPVIAADVRERLIASLDDPCLGAKGGDLLAALLFGARERLDRGLREAYGYLGIAHFLALSGLHLGILMLPLMWAVSFLPFGTAAKSAVVLAVIVSYSLVAGMPPSLVRAAALAAVFMLERSSGRKTTLARSLLLALLALALIDERLLLDGGFQLSCTAVFAIALVGIPLLRIIRSTILGKRAKGIAMLFVSPLVITVSVNIFALPLLLSFFGRAPLLAPVYNLLMVLPVTLLLYLGLAYAVLPFGCARRIISLPIGMISNALWHFPLKLAGHRQPALLAGGVCWPLYAAGVAILVFALRRENGRRGICACSALILLFASFVAGEGMRHRSAGSGGIAEPREISRHTMLYTDRLLVIDEDIGRWEAETAVRTIWKAGIGRIERLVISPARLGGRGGVAYIVSRIEFEKALCSPYLALHDGGLMKILRARGIETSFVEKTDSLMAGGWKICIIAPLYPPPPSEPVPVERACLRIVASPAGTAGQFEN